jgi:hypothetical protein
VKVAIWITTDALGEPVEVGIGEPAKSGTRVVRVEVEFQPRPDVASELTITTRQGDGSAGPCRHFTIAPCPTCGKAQAADGA